MEEKYLYTIAIVVIFAGFLFTSVGTYTGRLVSSTYNEPNVERVDVLDPSYSSDSRSSATVGFSGQLESPVQRTNCDGYVCCEKSQEGDQKVDSEINGLYSTCVGGKWLPDKCRSDYNRAIQKLDNGKPVVTCSSRETSPRY